MVEGSLPRDTRDPSLRELSAKGIIAVTDKERKNSPRSRTDLCSANPDWKVDRERRRAC